MTIFEQLGNIASEISRAMNWENKGDEVSKKNALERALELIDLTLAGNRTNREMTRLKEFVAEHYLSNGNYRVQLSEIYDYLLPFALVARNYNS